MPCVDADLNISIHANETIWLPLVITAPAPLQVLEMAKRGQKSKDQGSKQVLSDLYSLFGSEKKGKARRRAIFKQQEQAVSTGTQELRVSAGSSAGGVVGDKDGGYKGSMPNTVQQAIAEGTEAGCEWILDIGEMRVPSASL